MFKNDHRQENCATIIGKLVQTIWTPGQGNIRLRTPVRVETFVELLKLLGIRSSLSTAYHPQMDGTTERINQEIEAYLAIYCASHPEEWLTALHTLEFTHNNRRHADRQKTPFELMFGDSPLAIPHSFENTRFPAVEAKMRQLQKNREEARAGPHQDD